MKTNKTKQGYFAQTPLELLKDEREGITSYTLAVYAAIHSYTDFGKTVGAYPTTEQIAARAHCSTRTVERERELLKELGYLTWIPGNFKRHQGNAYTLFPSGRRKQATPSTVPQAEEASLFPSNRRSIDRPTDGNTDRLLGGTQRASTNREPLQRQPEEARRKCSHPDDKLCSKCLTPTVVSRPVRPPSESQDDEDF